MSESIAQFWHGLPTGGKVAVGIGAAVLVYYVYKGGFGSTSSSGGILSPSSTAGIPAGTPLGGTSGGGSTSPVLSIPSGSIASNPSGNTTLPGTGTQAQSGGSTNTPSPTVSPVTASLPPSSPSNFGAGSSSKSTSPSYAPITVVASHPAQSSLNSIAKSNPGSPVIAVNGSGQRTGYAITKTGPGGTFTANNYNQAVNGAGGQYIAGKDYAGIYTQNGSFVTNNPAQQAAYNKAVPTNPKPTTAPAYTVSRASNGNFTVRYANGATSNFANTPYNRKVFGY